MPDGKPGSGVPPRLGAVVLAAGGSSRMGCVKQLIELDGKPLIVRALEAALASGALPVVVVLGANAGRIRPSIAHLPVLVVENPGWAGGMASSIRAGLAALLAAEPATQAVLLTPCDQPALSSATIALLADLHRSTGRIAAARFHGRSGAPAVFGSVHFPALGSLAGDEGARRILNENPEWVVAADMPELGVDLDTPADRESWSGRRP